MTILELLRSAIDQNDLVNVEKMVGLLEKGYPLDYLVAEIAERFGSVDDAPMVAKTI